MAGERVVMTGGANYSASDSFADEAGCYAYMRISVNDDYAFVRTFFFAEAAPPKYIRCMALDVVKIREAREKKKWTQQQAAEAAAIGSAQRWNDIESGRRTNITLDTLESIAKALGVSAKSLLLESK